MRIVWTPEAIQDRTDIWDYVVQDDPLSAVKLDKLFSEAVSSLSAHPMMGRTGAIEGTRELVPHKSYKVVYELFQGTVWILAVVHTSRLWPPLMKYDSSPQNYL